MMEPTTSQTGETDAVIKGSADTTEASFYDFFDRMTNGGRVLDQDWSTVPELPPRERLTQTEIHARQEWMRVRKKIEAYYLEKPLQQIHWTNDMLQQRVMPPVLATTCIEARSDAEATLPRPGRRVPAEIQPWSDFLQRVKKFQPENHAVPQNRATNTANSPFELSRLHLAQPRGLCSERHEMLYLVNLLNATLVERGLLGSLVTSPGPGVVVGQPSVVVLKRRANSETAHETEPADAKDGIAFVCVFQSTHNLLLPMSARQVCATYNRAYQAYVQRHETTVGWSRVGHPIGQLLGYMTDNGKRYGILSSGTRSYFLRIRKGDNVESVEISDALFVGQPDYLKAWVYLYQLDDKDEDVLETRNLNWKRMSRDPLVHAKRKQLPHPGSHDRDDAEPSSKATKASSEDIAAASTISSSTSVKASASGASAAGNVP